MNNVNTNKVIVVINNSYSQVQNMNTEVYNLLRKELSYLADPSAAMRGGYSYKRYLIDAKGFFPSGLIKRVLGVLVDAKVDIHVQERRLHPNRPWPPRRWTGPVPYDSQIRAVDSVFSKTMGLGGAVMPTGSGKSIVIALLALKGFKTLVVVPTLGLKQQLTDSLIACLSDTSHVTVENIDSPRLKTATNYDMLILDEVHHVASKTYQKLNKTAWKGIYYRICLSATYFRNEPNEQLLFEAIAGEPIYRLTYKDAVKNGFIVPVEAYYYDLPKQDNDLYGWRNVYEELVVKNEQRNALISDTILNLDSEGTSNLTLVKEIKHGQRLSELTGVPFANGMDAETKRYIDMFNRGEITSLIATTGVAGEGVDTKPCEYVIIAGLGKAKSSFMQQVGRCVRKYKDKQSGKVILFRDRSHKYCLRHFNEQVKVLSEEYGIKPIQLPGFK